jgi:hypothetical protein
VKTIRYGQISDIFYNLGHPDPIPNCEKCGRPILHRHEVAYPQKTYLEGAKLNGVGEIVVWINFHSGPYTSCEGETQRDLKPVQMALFEDAS